MALAAGSVSISDAGTASGSGLARTLYDSHDAGMSAEYGADYDAIKNSDDAAVRKGLAVLANAYAAGIIAEIKANGEAVIPMGAAGAGLQTTTNVGVATDGPAAEERIGLD